MDRLHKSIIGASHVKDGKPMQDWSRSEVVETGEACIGVVCDGHGADKHFRSEIGSQLACDAAIEKLTGFYGAYRKFEAFNGKDLKGELDRLKLSIISNWQNKIEKHARENPFNEDDLKKTSASFKERKDYDVSSPYGTTLLAVLMCRDYYLSMMIGDGAIVKISPDAKCEFVKFEGKNIFDDEPHSTTDSLCDAGCFNNLHADLQPYNGDMAFGLCTDGMSEAFENDEALFKRFCIYINFWAAEGREKAEEAISGQLEELSKLSPMKDDISIAIITNNLKAYVKKKPAENTNNITEDAKNSAGDTNNAEEDIKND